MDFADFNPRSIAKYAVSTIIQAKVADRASEAIVDYTRHEEGDLVTKIGSRVIGAGVAAAAKPYTDKMVDKTVDFIAAKREARKTKKNKTNEQ